MAILADETGLLLIIRLLDRLIAERKMGRRLSQAHH